MTAPWMVIDSSVAMKWFVAEDEGCTLAWELLEQHRNLQLRLVAPTLMRLEVLNNLRRHANAEKLRAAADDLDGFCLEWVETNASLAAEAAVIACDHGLTVYDAVFVAVAQRFDAELVTADGQILRSKACRLRACEG